MTDHQIYFSCFLSFLVGFAIGAHVINEMDMAKFLKVKTKRGGIPFPRRKR
jgi:hypothetical protein